MNVSSRKQEADVEAVTSELTSLFGVSEIGPTTWQAHPNEMGKVSMAIEEDYIGKDPPIETVVLRTWVEDNVIIDDSHMKSAQSIFCGHSSLTGFRALGKSTDVDCSMLKKPWEKIASVIWSISQNSHIVLIGRLREFLERDGFSPGDVLVIVPTPECVYLLPPSVEEGTPPVFEDSGPVETDIPLTDETSPLASLL